MIDVFTDVLKKVATSIFKVAVWVTYMLMWLGNQESVGYMEKVARFPLYRISNALLSLQPLQYPHEKFVTEDGGRHYIPPESWKAQLADTVETQNRTNNSLAGGEGRVDLTVNQHLTFWNRSFTFKF
jgi:hypothetical protein